MNVQIRELVQTHVDAGHKQILLRTQDGSDIGKLATTIPRDQAGFFRAVWTKEGLLLELVDPPAPASRSDADQEALRAEYARLFGMSDEALASLAPELGIKWNVSPKVSRETKVMQMAKASLKAASDEQQ